VLEHDDYCEEYDDVDDNKLKTRPKEKIAVRLEAHPDSNWKTKNHFLNLSLDLNYVADENDDENEDVDDYLKFLD